MTINLENYLIFLLVMLRMTGMLVFNPIFSRRNVPVMLNAGLAFVLAVLLTRSMDFPALPDPTLFTFFYLALKELAVGMISGFIIQMFLSVLIIGGEVIDMQLGVGMAKVFDPASNASISVTSQIFNVMFVTGFFLSNNHLTLIHMTAQTFGIIPLGSLRFNPDALYAVTELFSTILIFAVKLCMPVVVMEVIVTFAVGMIMRVIPQINIFVVNIQFKLLIGMFVMVLLVPSFSAFFENLITISFENIRQIWIGFT